MKQAIGLLAVALAAPSLYSQTTTIQAETARLVFHAAPTGRGPLGKQIGDAVKRLRSFGQVVKVRAFVTSGADLNAAGAAIARSFPAKSRPVVNLVQIARLPDPAALVLLEGVAVSKKIENPAGIAFISGQMTQAALDPAQTKILVAPLVERSISGLRSIAGGLQVNPDNVLRVNCFAASLEDSARVQDLVSGAFPKAEVSVMQIVRLPANQFIECEAVARLAAKPAEPVRLVNPTNAAFAQSAVVAAPKVIFTTTYPVPSNDDAGVRQALTKLRGDLEAAGSGIDRAFYVYAYPGSANMLDRYRAVRFDFLERAKAPASTNLVFEGGGASGSGLGVDAIAVPK